MMFERISASFQLARSSWQVLRTDKQLILFPILSALGCFLVLATFAVPGAIFWPQLQQVFDDAANGGQLPWWMYVVAFVYYFCNYFVIIFCNAALISCALLRFNGETPTLGDGFRAAGSRLPQIAAWALVSATVGMLLQAVENAHEKAGALIRGLLGTAWTIMTYFVVPVLVVEQVGPFQAIKRSLAILRKTWGEALVGNLGLGLFKLLLMLPGILMLVAGIAVLTGTNLWPAGVALIVAAVVLLVLAGAAGAALSGIFLTALYQYAANDQVPAGFDRRMLEHAFEPKSA